MIDRLKDAGYNRDVQISEDLWYECLENEHEISRSLAAIEHKDEKTFRDSKSIRSIELKDYRNMEGEVDFVAELEHFNPEKHPLLYVLIDFPIWLWKTRIKNSGPLEG